MYTYNAYSSEAFDTRENFENMEQFGAFRWIF